MRVAPLPQFSADDLAPVLDEEVHCWSRDLAWDYRSSARAISKCLNSRSLQGYALRGREGGAAGYCYHLVDGSVGYIGNFYVTRKAASRAAYKSLLDATLADLRRSRDVTRIECQFVPFNCDVSELFVAAGFEAVRRRFMARPLARGEAAETNRGRRCVSPWDPAYLQSAARVIRDSYQASRDYDLCADYQSLPGVLRFLRNLVENSGCGNFCPRTSMVGFDSDGAVTSVLLSSRIAESTHMIPQVSVAPPHQNQGWGTVLLRSHFARAANEGSARTVLCVSDCNEGALRLYRRLGFEDQKSFHAFIWKAFPPRTRTLTRKTSP